MIRRRGGLLDNLYLWCLLASAKYGCSRAFLQIKQELLRNWNRSQSLYFALRTYFMWIKKQMRRFRFGVLLTRADSRPLVVVLDLDFW